MGNPLDGRPKAYAAALAMPYATLTQDLLQRIEP
jgi:hypothetical protein